MADNVSAKDVTAVTSEDVDSLVTPSILRGDVTVRLNKSTFKKRYMYRFFKRVFDIVFSGVICLVALVPGAMLCVAIRLDSPGSPFFRQSRVGKDGKEIRIFKFRSMYVDAHEHPEKYLDEGQLAHWLREQKVDNDPRIASRIIDATARRSSFGPAVASVFPPKMTEISAVFSQVKLSISNLRNLLKNSFQNLSSHTPATTNFFAERKSAPISWGGGLPMPCHCESMAA